MKRLQFEGFVIDRGRRELVAGGELVHLSPKAYHLLEMLVDSAPDAISRDTLYQGLWPDTFVDEANLPNLVKELRKALRDDSRNPRYIRTLHGFGYAFNEVPRAEAGDAEKWSPFVLQWAAREFPLRLGPNVIGRDPASDIRVDSSGVSRQHARITAGEAGVTIQDLGSKNGTFVDERPVPGAAPLIDGSTIRLGSATLTLRETTTNETTMTVGGGIHKS